MWKRYTATLLVLAIAVLTGGLSISQAAPKALSKPGSGIEGVSTGTGEMKESILPKETRDRCKSEAYLLEFADPAPQDVPEDIQSAMRGALCDWKGEPPVASTFYVVSMKMADDWGFASLAYDTQEQETRRHSSDQEVVSKTTNIIYKLKNDAWEAAIKDSQSFNKTLLELPDTRLSSRSKQEIVGGGTNASLSSSTNTTMAVTQPTSEQQYYGYQLPWPANDNYRLGSNLWHDGYSIDFIVDGQSAANSEIIAASSGTITNICHNPGNDQAWIHLATADGEFKYLHLSSQSVKRLGYELLDTVDQGQILGTLTPNKAYGESPCKMHSTAAHLHFVFPKRPFRIDGLYFGATNNEIPSTFPSTQCSPRPKPATPQPPGWTINSGRNVSNQQRCSIKGSIDNLVGNTIGIGNVTVENNVLVTIDTRSDKCVNVANCSPADQSHKVDTKLNLDFQSHRLLIKEGSGVLVKEGAKIY